MLIKILSLFKRHFLLATLRLNLILLEDNLFYLMNMLANYILIFLSLYFEAILQFKLIFFRVPVMYLMIMQIFISGIYMVLELELLNHNFMTCIEKLPLFKELFAKNERKLWLKI